MSLPVARCIHRSLLRAGKDAARKASSTTVVASRRSRRRMVRAALTGSYGKGACTAAGAGRGIRPWSAIRTVVSLVLETLVGFAPLWETEVTGPGAGVDAGAAEESL